jgi:hypothetical protein
MKRSSRELHVLSAARGLALACLIGSLARCSSETSNSTTPNEGASAGVGAGGAATTTSGSATTGGASSTTVATTGSATTGGASSTGASTSTSASGTGATGGSGGGAGDPHQQCVDTINQFRATVGLPAYARWNDEEACADSQAQSDAEAMMVHTTFMQCGEKAANECAGWVGPADTMIGPCLQQMWNEGPGSDFPTHGDYINMTSTQYTKVACGFYTLPNGIVWALQDFGF